ncbi:MAG: M20/M25/M40 family metallo-hydrolase [Gemmatimonadota bacterium]|nr:MAG: M20/M25/M40 family metallo-hydrolase [Gemmatimonadota bacterium]
MRKILVVLGLGAAVYVSPVEAQTFAVEDPVLQQMWQQGMENSQAYQLAQVLLDSLGPRLTGTPEQRAAHDWITAVYQRWGIEARNEQYGTWKGWQRGATHVDLIAPRFRTLEAIMHAWSPGTDGEVRAGVVVLPEVTDSAAFAEWLPNVKGKFVLVSFPEPTCRPDSDWEENATAESFERMKAQRDTAREAWEEGMERTGLGRELARQLEDAGAAGVLYGERPLGWGVMRVFSARTEKVPSIQLSCEDYGLLHRLAANNQGPMLAVEVAAEFLGEVPLFNTIAEIRGKELPGEYIVLSAHFDSWDGASGATDDGTGTVTILEAMRIIQQAYPNPRRTIIAGHWNSEEQGLNGSRAFVTDHPEVVEGLQALFNQDNGTGRISRISMQGLIGAGEHFARWLARVPQEIGQHIDLTFPGMPGGGGSDYASFLCAGAPSFFLFAHNWSYFPYTWHTNRDTFDKLVMDDLKNNATLFAMLAYLASEDPDRVPRLQRVLPVSERTGEQRTWPECRDGARSWEEER